MATNKSIILREDSLETYKQLATMLDKGGFTVASFTQTRDIPARNLFHQPTKRNKGEYELVTDDNFWIGDLINSKILCPWMLDVSIFVDKSELRPYGRLTGNQFRAELISLRNKYEYVNPILITGRHNCTGFDDIALTVLEKEPKGFSENIASIFRSRLQ